jgi:hypothetical protein
MDESGLLMHQGLSGEVVEPTGLKFPNLSTFGELYCQVPQILGLGEDGNYTTSPDFFVGVRFFFKEKERRGLVHSINPLDESMLVALISEDGPTQWAYLGMKNPPKNSLRIQPGTQVYWGIFDLNQQNK